MKNFFTGFVVASFIWIGLLYAYQTVKFDFFRSLDDTESTIQTDVSEMETLQPDKKNKKRRKRRSMRRNKTRALTSGDMGYDTGEGISGDNLGGPASRELALGSAGGEEQLSPADIDRGIDRVFNGIQRCLVLVPSNAPATGRVVLGMHITSDGQVTKVNLKGPNTIIKGESGACIRRVVKSIRYPGFDGPDMLAHYPITFD